MEHEETKQPPNMNDITWRIFRIMAEFVEGFQFLSESSREVTIFGSARTREGSRWYNEAYTLGSLLARHKFTVITGGGPGIMEAANRGAFENGGESIGLNIQLPTEQRINPYVKRSRGFYYFFTRKVMLAASAQAYIYFPGGFGTLDECFEIITLIQTHKMQKTPVILVGKEYWDPLWAWIKTQVLETQQAIAPGDLDLVSIVDTAEEAFAFIKDSEERTLF
ncbi:TPA: TIGR00730 family Rossman fold protein [Candidatus Uhrbacteria bacterium]|nr:TIGR00730 family Rossman fold protein [Candidatus Uhrbacteria bacterium]HCB19441.1 TIGR00730 family Rossman fold protein [Candidatus Uhrbacteria bacterium]